LGKTTSVRVGGRLLSPAERGRSVSLAAGYHAIKVAFFNGPKGSNLSVTWRPPGEKKQLLPADVLYHAEE